MNSVDCILEQFNLDPLRHLQDDDPYNVFNEDGNSFLEDAISTTSSGATRKNIIQKIWGFIKKILSYIGKVFLKFLNFLKGIFKRKGKSVDQIADEIGIIPVNNPVSNVIEIPSNPLSELELEETVSMIIKPVQIKIDSDKNTITFNHSQTAKNIWYGNKELPPKSGGKQGKIVGQSAVNRNGLLDDFDRVLIMMKNPNLMGLIQKMANMIKDYNKSFEDEFHQALSEFLRDINTKVSSKDHLSDTITFDELMNFQKWINEINKTIMGIDIPENNAMGEEFNVNIANAMNQVAQQVSTLQMGINTISSTIRSCYIADAKYYESIKDTTVLSRFVDMCIKSSIPPKYISYNVYLLSNKIIKGKGKEDSPIWGQSRVVLYPNDKSIVHKIALSGWGIRANISEKNLSDKFRSMHGDNLLAHVTRMSDSGSVIDMERADMNTKPESHVVEILKARIDKFATDQKIPMNITSDIHAANVGVKNGNLVAVDYGNLSRNENYKTS